MPVEPAPPTPFAKLTVSPESADQAAALLLREGASGLEVRDGDTLVAAQAGTVVLLAYFATLDQARQAARDAEAELGAACHGAEAGSLIDPGWSEGWRKFFGPMRFGRRLWVAPPGDPLPGAGPDAVAVRLLPSIAFGTGSQEPTALVLELLDELVVPGLEVLDVGCGSGVLALGALLLGAASARAIDVDPDAVEETRRNARSNRLARRLRVDATPPERLRRRYDLVLANLDAAEIRGVYRALASRVRAGGRLVWSGLLETDLSRVPTPPEHTLLEQRTRNGWVAQVWFRP